MSKNLSKKNLSKYSQKLLDHAWKSVIDAFKTSSKKAIQEQQKQLVTLLILKLLIKLQNSQEPYLRILQRKIKLN